MRTTRKIRPLTRDDVEFERRIEPCDFPFEGNCSAIDPETDAENEQWIRHELEGGNDLAWCQVLIVCRPVDPRLATFEGYASLGGCSARDMRDLDACCGFDGMESEALAHLNQQIDAMRATLCGGK